MPEPDGLLMEVGVAARVLEHAGAEATWIVWADGTPSFWGKPQEQLELGEALGTMGDLLRESIESYVAFMRSLIELIGAQPDE